MPVSSRQASELLDMSVFRSSLRLRVVTLFGIFSISFIPILLATWVSGSTLEDAVRSSGVVGLSVIPGSALWRRLRPAPISILEALGGGLVLGAIWLTAAWQLQRVTEISHLTITLLTVSAALTLLVRPKFALTYSSSDPLAAIPFLMGLFMVWPFFRETPLRPKGWFAYFGDTPFHEALSKGVSLFGPGDAIFAFGQTIRYHWLGNGWAGALAQITDTAGYVTVTRSLVVVAILASIALVWSWISSYKRGWLAPLLASTLLVGVTIFPTSFEGTSTLIVSVFSPTHTFALPFLLATSLIFVTQLNTGSRRSELVLLYILGAGLMAARANQAIVLMGAAGLTGVYLLLGRRELVGLWFRLMSTLTLGIVTTYVSFHMGATVNTFSLQTNTDMVSASGLVPIGNEVGLYLGVPALVPALSIGLVGLLPLLSYRSVSRAERIAGVWASGGLFLGLLLVFTTSQAGLSQIKFAWSALLFAAPIAGLGLAVAVEKLQEQGERTSRVVLSLSLGAIVAVPMTGFMTATTGMRFGGLIRWSFPIGFFLLVLLFWLLGTRKHSRLHFGEFALLAASAAVVSASTFGTLSRLSAELHPVYSQTPLAFNESHTEAAEWLDMKAGMNDVIVTNVQCGVWSDLPPECGSINFFVSANVGRRVLIEGQSFSAGYSPMWDVPLPDWARERIEASSGFTRNADLKDACFLADSGANWVWLDHRIPRAQNYEPFAKEVFQNSSVTILQMLPNDPWRDLCPVSADPPVQDQ